MNRHEFNDGQAAEETAVQEPAEDSAAETVSPAADPGDGITEPEVLARLPDLDAPDSSEEAEPEPVRSDGRILSPRLSTKLLMGGGAVLVLAAILPFLLKKNSEPKPGTPLAPDADLAPAWNGNSAQAPNVEPALPNIPYQANTSFNPNAPAGPDLANAAQGTRAGPSPQTAPWNGQNQPYWLGGQGQTPDWGSQSQQPTFHGSTQVPSVADRIRTWDDRRQTSAAERQPPVPAWPDPSPAPSIWDGRQMVAPPAATGTTTPYGHSPPGTYDDRYRASQPSPGYYRGYPYRQTDDSQPHARANQTMRIGDPTRMETGVPPRDDRQGYQTDSPTGRRPTYQADSRADPRNRYSAWTMPPYRSAEPGVAHLEGIIQKPSVRTTYDRTRSSVH